MTHLMKTFLQQACIVVALISVALPGSAQTPVALVDLTPRNYPVVEGLNVFHVQDQVYMISGAGGNVTVQIGDEGILLVDTGAPGETDRLMAAIASLSIAPVRYILNTHADLAHVAGNGALVDANFGVRGARPRTMGARPNQNLGVQIVSSENTFTRMILGEGIPAITGDALPSSFFFTAKKEFFSNGEAIQMLHQPNAHSDGDVLVFFRKSDVISAGDIFSTLSYPVIDTDNGGSIQGVIDALNNIIDIAIPERNQMGGTRIVPGHGRIATESDIVEYRDMVTILRDRVRDMAASGMSLAQIQNSSVSLEYDGLYADENGPWTRDMFLEAVYRGVTEQ